MKTDCRSNSYKVVVSYPGCWSKPKLDVVRLDRAYQEVTMGQLISLKDLLIEKIEKELKLVHSKINKGASTETKTEPTYKVWFKNGKHYTSDKKGNLYFYVDKKTKNYIINMVNIFSKLVNNTAHISSYSRIIFHDIKGTHHNIPVYRKTRICIRKR
jgi:hypothetical protein